ncbi:3-keto-5-aminohexanoate cleavage protein [Streptomyces sp. NPDC014861]|uniref:3-keto-5-aminohexanoate cleavage protein n=1 Tax=Streptomyces sp. NPDC014861 TaxID=3364923 RepID=UPI0036FF473D
MTRPEVGALQAALNGTRGPGESAAVPREPVALAEAAAEAVAAGADEVRLRPRTPCGAGSLSPRVVGPALAAVRECVRVPVSVPVDVWAEADPRRRVARILSWEFLPDLACVTWHEPGAEEVAEALLARGVAVEAGLRAGTAGPALFARSPLAGRVLRIVAEVPDAGAGPWAHAPGARHGEVLAPGAGHGEVTVLGARLDAVPVMLCGTGAAAWPALRLARRLAVSARIGLEDTLLLPDGSRARSTAEQIRAALSDGPEGPWDLSPHPSPRRTGG